MRTDLFRDRKGVHVKLKKDVHAEFRKKLFEHGISMQKVFNEFARLVANGDNRAMGIVRRLVQRELQAKLQELNEQKHREESLDELDQEALYDLIEGGNDELQGDPAEGP